MKQPTCGRMVTPEEWARRLGLDDPDGAGRQWVLNNWTHEQGKRRLGHRTVRICEDLAEQYLTK